MPLRQQAPQLLLLQRLQLTRLPLLALAPVVIGFVLVFRRVARFVTRKGLEPSGQIALSGFGTLGPPNGPVR